VVIKPENIGSHRLTEVRGVRGWLWLTVSNRQPQVLLYVPTESRVWEPRAVALVALGGFAGATSRYGISTLLPAAFPWGTLAVNVVGCFLLGYVVYTVEDRGPISDRLRLFVASGFVSSFTTYSTFAGETVALEPTSAALNVAGNYLLGFLAVLFAREVVRWRS